MTTHPTPTITSLAVTVLDDKRRVNVEMSVDNLPTLIPNVTLTMPDDAADDAADLSDSPYPNIAMRVLNAEQREVADLLIVEYKEPRASLTLHLREPQPSGRYTLHAEMMYDVDEPIHTTAITFEI